MNEKFEVRFFYILKNPGGWYCGLDGEFKELKIKDARRWDTIDEIIHVMAWDDLKNVEIITCKVDINFVSRQKLQLENML